MARSAIRLQSGCGSAVVGYVAAPTVRKFYSRYLVQSLTARRCTFWHFYLKSSAGKSVISQFTVRQFTTRSTRLLVTLHQDTPLSANATSAIVLRWRGYPRRRASWRGYSWRISCHQEVLTFYFSPVPTPTAVQGTLPKSYSTGICSVNVPAGIHTGMSASSSMYEESTWQHLKLKFKYHTTTIVPTRQGIVPDFQQWGYHYNDDDHVPSSKLLLPPSARECHPLAAKRYLICRKDFSGDLLRAFKFLQTNMLWLKWHRRWLVYYAIVLLQDVGECGAVHSTMILVILESPFFNAEENH